MKRVGSLRFPTGDSYEITHHNPEGEEWKHSFFLQPDGHSWVDRVGSAHHVSLGLANEELNLAGMFVTSERRGCGVSAALMEAAFQVSEITGIPLGRTVRIRKPLLALLLRKYGFTAVSQSTVAEILPKEEGVVVPKVRVSTLKQRLPQRSEWFTRVEGEVNKDSSNPKIPIYTKWELSDPDLARTKRDLEQGFSGWDLQLCRDALGSIFHA